MQDVIKLCNDNQGLIMVALTVVYVLATIGIAFLGARANSISQKNVATLTELEQERSRPMVEVKLGGDVPFLLLVITNQGQTPAYDVRLTTEPRLQLLLGGENAIPKEKSEKQIGIVEHGVGTLGAGASESALIGTYSRIKEVYPGMTFTGRVSYRSFTGKTYETPVNIDIRYMDGSLHVKRKTIHDVANELEKIERILNHIGTGFHKPHVITEDIEHKRLADEAFIAEAMKRSADNDGKTV